MYKLVESFITLSGEAPIPGEPVFLVRFSGCNLKCAYCDTPYNAEVNCELSESGLEELIVKTCNSYPGLKVLFTGGEPFLGERARRLPVLMDRLRQFIFFVETNGSVPLGPYVPDNCRCVVDWKTPSSGHGDSFLEENLEWMRPGLDCIKMVVSGADLGWVKEKITFIQKRTPGLALFLSAQWDTVSLEELARFILDNRLRANLSVQLHKIIWGNEARGV